VEIVELNLVILFGIVRELSQAINTCLAEADDLNVFRNEIPPSFVLPMGEKRHECVYIPDLGKNTRPNHHPLTQSPCLRSMALSFIIILFEMIAVK
jgi:hypothetical protein